METTTVNPTPETPKKKNFGSILLVACLIGAIFYLGGNYVAGLLNPGAAADSTLVKTVDSASVKVADTTKVLVADSTSSPVIDTLKKK